MNDKQLTARDIDRMFRAIDRTIFGRTATERAAAHERHEEGSASERVQRGEQANVELRLEVIEALVAEGMTRAVAAERTNTTAKLLAEAIRLDII